jgi:peptidoglycan/xylan/chitin deacetylase (PgdA/CDA1 family)
MVFVSPAWIHGELDDTDRVIEAAGAPRPRWFRPPYGKKGFVLPWVLAQTGRTTVTWDVEPESDPALADDPDALVRAVRAQVQPGSIVLLHPWYGSRAATRAALPALLDGLREDGWSLVTVSELLGGG